MLPARRHRGSRGTTSLGHRTFFAVGDVTRSPCAPFVPPRPRSPAIATIASPLATATTADAAGQAGPVIRLDVDWYGVAFSPNGDHSQDKARIAFTLARKSEVIVKIRRTNEARTLVYKEKLGKVTRGDHTWVWNGKNRNGKVVKDGHYTAVFVADEVAEDGKKQSRGTAVYVDTRFDAAWAPRTSADTVYPNTAGYPTDFVGLTLGNVPDDPMTSLGKVAEIVTDAEGRVVSKQQPFQYLSSGYVLLHAALVPWDVMPRTTRYRRGPTRLRFSVRDLAGNPGGTQGGDRERLGPATGRGDRVRGGRADRRLESLRAVRRAEEATTCRPSRAAPWCPPRCTPTRVR